MRAGTIEQCKQMWCIVADCTVSLEDTVCIDIYIHNNISFQDDREIPPQTHFKKPQVDCDRIGLASAAIPLSKKVLLVR